jgi:ABC-type thiamin/hydroxymethylpyrimidine transport system permease subunit
VEYLFRLKGWATLSMVGVSLLFLVRLWRKGELFGTQEVIFCVWFVAALVTQLLAQSPGAWIAGLVAQLVLAVVLVLKDRIDSIY